tara:strand:+ start:13979 stop:14890 length:912 start_codon:yes stop_codon:yes gene_type:complete
MIEEFQLYYNKAKLNQQRLYEGYDWTKEDIDDDLIWHVPIYDVVNRRYAAFSSFLEALIHGENDPKGNGNYFKHVGLNDFDFMLLCYLFRLCGSGINYKPKTAKPFSTHGFGNFWVVDSLINNRFTFDQWIEDLPVRKFSDNKGYLLPMIPKGLRNFIIEDSKQLVTYILDNMWGLEIYEIVDLGNEWLLRRGYKRQNFVLCAFAMDLAEYYPKIIPRNSHVYVGSNARKCLKLIFPDRKGLGSNLKSTNDALEFLCNLTGNFSQKYDMEDVACDFIRYKNNFQSKHHVEYNNGIKYYNSVFK